MIQIKKGLDLPIQGNPKNVISESPRVTSCGILGPDYIGMKPTMLVKEGDQVLGGEALFEDKKNPGNFFTAPTSGIVTAVNRGEQRRLLSVEIDLDGKNLNKQFNFSDDKSAQIEALTKSGQFNYFRTRPFNKIPSINSFPNEIFINACNSNPNSNDPFIYINQEQDLFDFGLKTLKNLYDCTIHVCYSHDDFQQNINSVNYHQFIGPHPSGLSGTHIHYISPVNEKSKTWYLDAQGLLSIAHFFKHAEIRNHKYVSIGGPSIEEPKLIKTFVGSNCFELVAGNIKNDSRLISGSVLHGFEITSSIMFLGFYHNQISALPNTFQSTFMNWLRFGTNLHSKLGVFISNWIKPGQFNFNTALNGSNRGIVPIPAYDEVMPLNIMIIQLLKALVVKDFESAIQLGALELAPEDLALCSYVCPSKYDFCSILDENLEIIFNEIQ